MLLHTTSDNQLLFFLFQHFHSISNCLSLFMSMSIRILEILIRKEVRQIDLEINRYEFSWELSQDNYTKEYAKSPNIQSLKFLLTRTSFSHYFQFIQHQFKVQSCILIFFFFLGFMFLIFLCFKLNLSFALFCTTSDNKLFKLFLKFSYIYVNVKFNLN